MENIDKFDLEIISAFREEGAVWPNATKISKAMRKPTATVHSRIKKMEKDGVIRSYIPVLDYSKTGVGINGFALLKVRPGKSLDDVVSKLRAMDEVKEIYMLMGRWKLLINTRTKDMPEHAKLVNRLYDQVSEITEVYDMIAPQTYKRTF